MKTRIMICLILACMLTGIAQAELTATDKEKVTEILFNMEQWHQTIKQYKETLTDEDSQLLLNYADGIILTAQGVFLTDMQSPNNEIAFEDSDLYESALSLYGDYSSYTSCLHKLNGSSTYALPKVVVRDQYIQAEYSLYSENGEYLATVRAEAAEKENETAILIVDYDNLDVTTGRFLMHIVDGKPEIFFTKTLGMTLSTIFDPDAWQRGEAVEWNKRLLYSSEYLPGN